MAESTEELLNQLYTMVQDAFTLPFGGDKCVLERDKVLDLIDEVNASLPNDLKQARAIVEARNEVLSKAKSEAELIRSQAEERARALVAQEEIQRQAKEKANEMITSANAKSKEIYVATVNYVDDAFKRTEEALAQALTEIRTSRNQFRQESGSKAKNQQTDVEL